MFTTTADVRLISFMTTTELISIPTGFMYIAAIGTLWQGRLRLKTPMLYVFMGMLNFLIGGFTGVFLADVPADFQFNKIGRAHVCAPVTNAHLVCRLLLEKKKTTSTPTSLHNRQQRT